MHIDMQEDIPSESPNDFEEIVSLDCSESPVDMLKPIPGVLFNDDGVTLDNKDLNNTKSLLENSGLKTMLENNQDMVSNWPESKQSQLELHNSQLEQENDQLKAHNTQLEPQFEVHSDGEATGSTQDLYLQNFMFIMMTVLSQKEDKELFNDNDVNVIESFQELSDKSKTLYVRLFQRKYKWFQTRSIKYPQISEDLQSCFDELIKAGTLVVPAN